MEIIEAALNWRNEWPDMEDEIEASDDCSCEVCQLIRACDEYLLQRATIAEQHNIEQRKIKMENIWIEGARQLAAQCWRDPETIHIIRHISLCEAVAKRIAHWMEIAAQNQRNTDYYRGLLVKCGEAIGDKAYIADDGTRSEDVLCAKIPEIIDAAFCEGKEEYDEVETDTRHYGDNY